MATLAAHIHAATWRLLTLIAELDRRGVWADQGALTCAHWLGWACGIDAHTAREKVRFARALEGLPLLSEAVARGELGYSKLRALTRIATSENEADLVDIGLHGTAQHVEKFVRLYRQAERAQETEHADGQHKDRELTYWYEDDGTLVLHGRFPPETGARILSALDAAMEGHATEQSPPRSGAARARPRTSQVGRQMEWNRRSRHRHCPVRVGWTRLTSHLGRRRIGGNQSLDAGSTSPWSIPLSTSQVEHIRPASPTTTPSDSPSTPRPRWRTGMVSASTTTMR